MRILYGVVGEGMGHAIRSKTICEHLVSEGHEVKIVVSGRAHALLAASFDDVVKGGNAVAASGNQLVSAGTHNLFAVYAGDTLHATSSSSQVSQSVTAIAIATTLVAMLAVAITVVATPAGALSRDTAGRQSRAKDLTACSRLR